MMRCLIWLPWKLMACSRKEGKINKEYISYISAELSKAPSILSTTELEMSNKTNNPDINTDAEEWKPGTSLIVGDSMIAGLREAKLSRNRKVKVCFYPGAKMKDFYHYLVPLMEEKPDNIILHFRYKRHSLQKLRWNILRTKKYKRFYK